MGRPKKEMKENGTPEGYVSKANFMRTRDSVSFFLLFLVARW